MFNGQVMPWTTQDSQVPRIGLQCGRFPPICPKPGQKLSESLRRRLDLGLALARARVFHRVVLVVDRARQTGQALSTLAARPPRPGWPGCPPPLFPLTLARASPAHQLSMSAPRSWPGS